MNREIILAKLYDGLLVSGMGLGISVALSLAMALPFITYSFLHSNFCK